MSSEHAFTMTSAEREAALLPALRDLTAHHRSRSLPYRRILDALDFEAHRVERVSDVPWLPVRLFKNHEIHSLHNADVFKVMTSSGTTGSKPSRIHLDREAVTDQVRHLARTIGTVLGPRRVPMLLVDSRGVVADRQTFSARGAGLVGMAALGRRHAYLLDDRGHPDPQAVLAFLAENGREPFAIFGFTFMVWKHLLPMARQLGLDLSRGHLFHSGGWKRMQDESVDNAVFREALRTTTGLVKISNYYGMVEQLGTIFLEPPHGGDLYCPDFSDVIIRDPRTWDVAPDGTAGVIQVVSTVPRSYPGHSLLTEDLGVVHGVDDGFWPGKRFSVLGRIPRAEVRGCSDTVGAA